MTVQTTKDRQDLEFQRHIERTPDFLDALWANVLAVARVRERVCANLTVGKDADGEHELDCAAGNANWGAACTQGRYFACDEFAQPELSYEELKDQVFLTTATGHYLSRLAAQAGIVRRRWEPDYLLRIRVFNAFFTHLRRGARPGLQEEIGMIPRVLPVYERMRDGAWVWTLGFAGLGVDAALGCCKDFTGWCWRRPLCSNYVNELNDDFETTDLSNYDEYNTGNPGTWTVATDGSEVLDGEGPAADISILYDDESSAYEGDTVIRCRVKKTNAGGEIGILFFVQDGADADGDYYYLGFQDVNAGLFWRTSAGWDTLITWAAHGLTITNWNDIEVRVNPTDNKVKIYFNDVLWDTYTGNKAEAGRIGFAAMNGGDSRFDDVYAAYCTEDNSNFIDTCTTGDYEDCDGWANLDEDDVEAWLARAVPVDHRCGMKYVSHYLQQTDYSSGEVTVDEVWSGATTYDENDIVIYSVDSKIYRSLQDGNFNNVPPSEPDWWVEVFPLKFDIDGHIYVDEDIPGVHGVEITFTGEAIDLGTDYASWRWFIDWLSHRKEFEAPAPWADIRADFRLEYRQNNTAIGGPWGAWTAGELNEYIGYANRYLQYRFTVTVYEKNNEVERACWMFSGFNAKALTDEQAKYLVP